METERKDIEQAAPPVEADPEAAKRKARWIGLAIGALSAAGVITLGAMMTTETARDFMSWRNPALPIAEDTVSAVGVDEADKTRAPAGAVGLREQGEPR